MFQICILFWLQTSFQLLFWSFKLKDLKKICCKKFCQNLPKRYTWWTRSCTNFLLAVCSVWYPNICKVIAICVVANKWHRRVADFMSFDSATMQAYLCDVYGAIFEGLSCVKILLWLSPSDNQELILREKSAPGGPILTLFNSACSWLQNEHLELLNKILPTSPRLIFDVFFAF